jgi:integrase
MNLTTAADQFRQIKPWTRHGVAAFLAHCQVEDTRELELADLTAFFHALVAKGYTVGTYMAYRNQTNAFLRWLVAGGLVPFGLDSLKEVFTEQYWAMPVATTERAEVPEESEVRALIEAAHAVAPAVFPDTARGRQRRLVYLRNIAIVEMLRATGVRPSELVALRRCELDEARQCAYAPDGRRLCFDLESWGALARYLQARGDPVDCPLLMWRAPVFARHDGRSAGQGLVPLGQHAVRRIIANLRRSGSATKPRDLRARFARRLLEATEDERGTARLLGLKQTWGVRRYRPVGE